MHLSWQCTNSMNQASQSPSFFSVILPTQAVYRDSCFGQAEAHAARTSGMGSTTSACLFRVDDERERKSNKRLAFRKTIGMSDATFGGFSRFDVTGTDGSVKKQADHEDGAVGAFCKAVSHSLSIQTITILLLNHSDCNKTESTTYHGDILPSNSALCNSRLRFLRCGGEQRATN